MLYAFPFTVLVVCVCLTMSCRFTTWRMVQWRYIVEMQKETLESILMLWMQFQGTFIVAHSNFDLEHAVTSWLMV